MMGLEYGLCVIIKELVDLGKDDQLLLTHRTQPGVTHFQRMKVCSMVHNRVDETLRGNAGGQIT